MPQKSDSLGKLFTPVLDSWHNAIQAIQDQFFFPRRQMTGAGMAAYLPTPKKPNPAVVSGNRPPAMSRKIGAGVHTMGGTRQVKEPAKAPTPTPQAGFWSPTKLAVLYPQILQNPAMLESYRSWYYGTHLPEVSEGPRASVLEYTPPEFGYFTNRGGRTEIQWTPGDFGWNPEAVSTGGAAGGGGGDWEWLLPFLQSLGFAQPTPEPEKAAPVDYGPTILSNYLQEQYGF